MSKLFKECLQIFSLEASTFWILMYIEDPEIFTSVIFFKFNIEYAPPPHQSTKCHSPPQKNPNLQLAKITSISKSNPRPTYSMFTSIPFRHIKNHIGHDEQKIFARGKCSNHKSLSRWAFFYYGPKKLRIFFSRGNSKSTVWFLLEKLNFVHFMWKCVNQYITCFF